MINDPYRIDSHKLMFHPERVAKWLEAGSDWEKAKKVYPIYVEVSPSGGCNHRCVYCAMDYVGYKPRFLDMKVMEQRLPEMGRLGIKSIMFAGEGEPLLHPEITGLAKVAVDSGIDIAFTTNGVLLDEKLAKELIPITSWIKVSVDAGKPSTYSLLHGAKERDFANVIENLKRAVEFRNRGNYPCTIGAQLLLLPENADEIDILAAICRDDVGLDYLVIKPYSQHKFSMTKRYESIDYDKLIDKVKNIQSLSNGSFKVICRENTIKKHINRAHMIKECNAVPFFWAYLMSNNDLYSCSAFLKDKRFLVGNVGERGFEITWEGNRREHILAVMQNSFDIDECRVNCRMDSINEYLWQLKYSDSHLNFI